MEKLNKQEVCSPIHDENIKNNLQDSPIWRNCKHLSELSQEELSSGQWWQYSIKFNGVTPTQVVNIKQIKK